MTISIRSAVVSVHGLGYIGLPTAALLATTGYRVRGVDRNRRTVEVVKAGGIHIEEPGLDVLVESAVGSRRLSAGTEAGPADVFFISVPTPLTPAREPDLSAVRAATADIAPHLVAGNLVILESTSPPGTTLQVSAWLAEARPDLCIAGAIDGPLDRDPEIFVAHCPERVLPGRILRELVENDRIVGGVDETSTAKAAAFYATFVSGRVLTTSSTTAEMAKLTENAFRDVNIAFANELSMICERRGIDPWEVIRLANHHPRVQVLKPGPGVGGHCIAVDPWFLIYDDPDSAPLLRAARQVNDAKPDFVIEQVVAAHARRSREAVALLGLTYKADVDDLRESPALRIAQTIADRLADDRLLIAEPHLDQLPVGLADRASLLPVEAAVARAGVVVLLVDHSEFLGLDLQLLAGKTVIDTRGSWPRDVAGAPRPC